MHRSYNGAIPYTDFGGTGGLCHFAHANGYPPAAYAPLLEILGEHYHLIAMHFRPLWEGSDPREIDTWEPFAEDMIQFLSTRAEEPVIGIGHSVGGTTTLRAALQKPELFRMLILIDPVLFPPWVTPLWNLITLAGLEYRVFPLVPGALNSAQRRKTEFDSAEAMLANYRKKKVFERFDDAALEAYVHALIRKSDGARVKLNYSPDWEARIYVTAVRADLPLWAQLPELKVPLLVLRGSETNAFQPLTASLFHWRMPAAEILTVEDASHLLPLEKPAATASLIQKFIEKHTT